ncbi:MAG: hypothetical protein J7L82_03225 [Staphylothermus sp.]|nr:hypothetical protein [Staphylothermus sp.]
MEEIAIFLKNRWAGLEGEGKKWVRWLGNKPLRIDKPEDTPFIIKKYYFLKPRAIYGTIEVFRKLDYRKDVEENYENNVMKATPFIDIDILEEDKVEKVWKYAIKIGVLIRDWLREQGVKQSVYFLWSGAGLHVRINENAFNSVLREHHPVDVAFAVTEYILESLRPHILDIIRESSYLIKVENLVAMKRVFTAPLSLHRKLDRVAVPIDGEHIEEFSLEWCNPEKPVYDKGAWNKYDLGEGDKIAYKALNQIGKVAKRTLLEARATKIGISATQTKETVPTIATGEIREPGRFPVMALLQAARYYVLYGDLDKAKSFGLNRAIFYAWAKYYGPQKRTALYKPSTPRRIYGSRVSGPTRWVEVAGEKVQMNDKGYYVMGGIEQRPEDYDRYVAKKFEEAGIKYEEAWRKALEYIRKFPKTILLDPQKFYKEVYEPARDRFVEKILNGETTKKKRSLDEWFKSTN